MTSCRQFILKLITILWAQLNLFLDKSTEMKQPKLLLAGLAAICSLSFSAQHTIDPTNCREGEDFEYCRTHIRMNELKQNPAFLKIQAADQAIMKQRELQIRSEKSQGKGQVYTIPLVFHVLHMNGPENSSMEQIQSAVDILNRDFRLQNTDANTVQPTFQGMPADIEIEFALATIAPNGQCFNGVTRTYSPLTFDGSSGQAQLNAIKNGNDVYQGEWPGDEYLNIFVVDDAGGAGGYTYLPSNWLGNSMGNGIWIRNAQMGGVGTSISSRSLTHEVGHWLNLSHTWGPNNNPGNASSCTDDDDVDDTPRCIGTTSCLYALNSCSNDANDGYWSSDVVDNVENYMDYSGCSKMFTDGQRIRMRAAITSSVGGRNNIWQTSNLNAVGANGNAALCKSEFTADHMVICAGDSVIFTDESYHNVSGWDWTFTGGSPSVSTSQNETVIYSTPGTYSVTLAVTDGTNSVSETKTNYITVLPSTGDNTPIVEGFEWITFPGTDWFVENWDNANTFEITSSAGATGVKSLKLDNYNNDEGQVDAFISNTYNLSGLSGVVLTFKYAFAMRNPSNVDAMQVKVSNTCGATWSVRKNISSAQIETASMTNAPYTPSADDWEEVTITNISASYLVENFRFMIEFTAGGGNNLYIDDINIYDPNQVSVEENGIFNQLSVFPNPSDDITTVLFELKDQPESGEIVLFDMLGKQVYRIEGNQMNIGINRFEIPVGTLSKGIYELRIVCNKQSVSNKLIVE